jgi:hypothetical protein
MNLAQREAIARYAAKPDLDETAGACLQLALDGWASDTDPEPVFNPDRQAARIDRLRRDNQRRIADELAIHARIKREQLPDVRCPECGMTGWLKRVPGGHRCRSCDVMTTAESLLVPSGHHGVVDAPHP